MSSSFSAITNCSIFKRIAQGSENLNLILFIMTIIGFDSVFSLEIISNRWLFQRGKLKVPIKLIKCPLSIFVVILIKNETRVYSPKQTG